MNLTAGGRANLLLLLTSVIWGFAFVAQRTGMESVGPFTFNGLRFAIGGLVLLPVVVWLDRQRETAGLSTGWVAPGRALWLGGLVAGLFLFGGATLQQMGLIYTTAGKAGFITGLYVVLVPVLGLAFGRKTPAGTWLGVVLAVVGLYFLTIQDGFRMETGDLLVMLSAFVWAGHVLIVDRLAPQTDVIRLAFVQFMICAGLSLFAAALLETIRLEGIQSALPAILYAGIMSVGVGYTLQVVGQRHAQPAHAAIILSLEGVFAVLGGWLLLGEQLGPRGLLGCALMLAGILVSQLAGQRQATGGNEAAREII